MMTFPGKPMAFPPPFLRRGEASPGVAPARLPEAQCFEDSGQKNKGKNIIHIYILYIYVWVIYLTYSLLHINFT
jgi:hypothetical protein